MDIYFTAKVSKYLSVDNDSRLVSCCHINHIIPFLLQFAIHHLDVEQAERVEPPLEVEGDLVVEALRPPAVLRPERHRDRLAERVELQPDAPDGVQNTGEVGLLGCRLTVTANPR